MKMTNQFQIGRTYSTRSVCDHECVFFFIILDRTAKTITTQVHGKTVRRGLNVWNGAEQFKPFGNYSMCAIVGADDIEARPCAVCGRTKPEGDCCVEAGR
jgi:hypothetical protein